MEIAAKENKRILAKAGTHIPQEPHLSGYRFLFSSSHLPIPLKNRHLPVILIRIIRSDQRPALGSRRYHKKSVTPCTDDPVSSRKRISGRTCPRRIFGQQKPGLFDTLHKVVMLRWIAGIKSISENRNRIAAFFQTGSVCVRIDAFCHTADDGRRRCGIFFCQGGSGILIFLCAASGTDDSNSFLKWFQSTFAIQ